MICSDPERQESSASIFYLPFCSPSSCAQQCVLYACELRTFRFGYRLTFIEAGVLLKFSHFRPLKKKKNVAKREQQSRVGFFLSVDLKNVFLNLDVFVLFDFLVESE